MKILLFVSSSCSYCPKAEKVVSKVAPEYYEYGLKYKKIRIKTEEGKKLSTKFGIMSLPTILMLDDNGIELQKIVGVPSEENLKNKIEKELNLKKSFLSNILRK